MMGELAICLRPQKRPAAAAAADGASTISPREVGQLFGRYLLMLLARARTRGATRWLAFLSKKKERKLERK